MAAYIIGDVVRRQIGDKILYVNRSQFPRLLELDSSADQILQHFNDSLTALQAHNAIGHDAIKREDLLSFLEAASSLNLLVSDAPKKHEITGDNEEGSEAEALIASYAEENRIPVSTTVELTTRCNLRCRHCYLGRSKGSKPDLPIETCLSYLEQMVDAGCLWTSLTGGDPLLNRNFIKIYNYLTESGVLVTVLTNGTTLTPAVIETFRENKPFKVEVSIYGATKQTYENVTRAKGSYRKFLRNLDDLAQLEIPLELKGIMMTLNVHEFDQMRTIAADYGAFFRFTGDLFEQLNGSRQPIQYRLPVERVAELDFSDEERAAEICESVRNTTKPKSTSVYQCLAGQSCFHLSADGVIYPCITDRTTAFSLAEHNLRAIWSDLMPKAMDRHYSPADTCFNCQLQGLCRNCPAKSILATGKEVIPVPFLCELAQARYGLAQERG